MLFSINDYIVENFTIIPIFLSDVEAADPIFVGYPASGYTLKPLLV